jgi:hypothetical protein
MTSMTSEPKVLIRIIFIDAFPFGADNAGKTSRFRQVGDIDPGYMGT